jgi:hypothetical protein
MKFKIVSGENKTITSSYIIYHHFQLKMKLFLFHFPENLKLASHLLYIYLESIVFLKFSRKNICISPNSTCLNFIYL